MIESDQDSLERSLEDNSISDSATPDRPTSAPPSSSNQQSIFTPFTNSNFGGIFSDLGSMQYTEQSSALHESQGSNGQRDNFNVPTSSRNSGDVWGSGLGNHFANLSINSDLGVSDSSFLSPLSSNEQNLYPPSRQTTSGEIPNLFQNNPLSSNHQGYTPQFLWTDRVENPDNRIPSYQDHGGFTGLDYNSPNHNPMGQNRNTVSNSQGNRNDFSSHGPFMNIHNPISPRSQNPQLFSNYGSQNPIGSGGNFVVPGMGVHHIMNNPDSSNSISNNLMNHRPSSIDGYGGVGGFPSSNDRVVDSFRESGNSGNNQICRYFANGNCMRGDRCNYRHSRPDGIKNDQKKDKKSRYPPPATKANGRRARPGPVAMDPKKPPVDVSRFTSIEQVIGQVYRTCKDQHGCRFLQKKLEEKDQNPKVVEIIFEEVYDYMVELMTDPFGNYLCQKLIEHCNQQQQLLIVQKVAPHLVTISKNMHGTRAVQKMIECLCTPSQVQLVVNSLRSSVVSLIKDLNGNHVIQRCLHELSYSDKQFVYDAVAANCVEVATHRHGCCVMQRCIDSASEEQKLQLVRQISSNVLLLVQDQFGNYVVQYVLDLPFSTVKVNLIQEFLGNLASLSTQKFSSNVIEKCLHVADEKVKVQLIDELMEQHSLPELLQDAYGNYVIQTALTEAQPEQRARLEERIRPLLPALRNTNYGKRIQNKIALKDMDSLKMFA